MPSSAKPDAAPDAGALRDHVAALADHLRSGAAAPVTVAEVAGITEVLIASLQTFIGGLDTRIYAEFRDMADYMARAKAEILALHPRDLKEEQLPRAGRELTAIVTQTEQATHAIMGAAEALMNARAETVEDYRALVDAKVTEIFEACSFQDITGQRIAKVIETLDHIDRRLTDLVKVASDAEGKHAGQRTGTAAALRPTLLNGPALDGDGVSQAQVDALLR
ncbi:MAG: protein phosphatase CheZ [Alphaproteobacteria bacterium]|nr:protein phosphatase CheZ [Alphaproteobacteria bacterium]MDX5369161.1 protein phosphatase CheZ [Alphaproteobacteria bacterium]MDX5463857.1 protein phosphatase CheZ [Alphaproteobacteria bacterium]